MNYKNRISIIKKFKKIYPDTTIGLIYNSNFELLIALILSAKSTDIVVNKVTRNLFAKANTPEKILSLDKSFIENIIKSVGFFRRKTENIVKMCQTLIDQYDGIIPNSKKLLEDLPGVGRKVANVMLNVAFHKPIIAVDTHVFRVCNRTKFLCEKNYIILEKTLNSIVPKKFRMQFHHWFVSHGRNICKAKKPNCKSCSIKDLCKFENKQFYLV